MFLVSQTLPSICNSHEEDPSAVANWGVPPTTGSRLPHIDGARALAASSIVVYHVWRYGAAGGPPSLGPPGRVMPHLALGITLFFTPQVSSCTAPSRQRSLADAPAQIWPPIS